MDKKAKKEASFAAKTGNGEDNESQYSGYAERDTARGFIEGPSQMTIIINPVTESYEIGHLIGEGVYGDIYICTHRATR